MVVWAEGNSGVRARPCDHIVMGLGALVGVLGTSSSAGCGVGDSLETFFTAAACLLSQQCVCTMLCLATAPGSISGSGMRESAALLKSGCRVFLISMLSARCGACSEEEINLLWIMPGCPNTPAQLLCGGYSSFM